jgi:hypothetical protein
MGLIRWGMVVLATLSVALIATVWFLPASLIWRLIEPNLSLDQDVRVALPRGSWRQGHMLVQFRGFPPSRVSWQADWPSFIDDSLALTQTVSLAGSGHQITGTLQLLLNQEAVLIEQLSGEVRSSDINQLAGAYGHHFSGLVTLKNGYVTISAQCVNALAGYLSWSGGPVSLNGFNGVAHYQLPPLQANLDLENCSPALNLTRDGAPLARLVLGLDGWFRAQVQPRLLILAQVPGAAQLTDPLLFEEKIL